MTSKHVCVTTLNDVRGYTLLNYAAYMNNEEAARVLFDFGYANAICTENRSRNEMMKDWANRSSDLGVTPIHWASFHGNLPLIQMLDKEMHCDINCTNK